jgi:hypothetical protein
MNSFIDYSNSNYKNNPLFKTLCLGDAIHDFVKVILINEKDKDKDKTYKNKVKKAVIGNFYKNVTDIKHIVSYYTSDSQMIKNIMDGKYIGTDGNIIEDQILKSYFNKYNTTTINVFPDSSTQDINNNNAKLLFEYTRVRSLNPKDGDFYLDDKVRQLLKKYLNSFFISETKKAGHVIDMSPVGLNNIYCNTSMDDNKYFVHIVDEANKWDMAGNAMNKNQETCCKGGKCGNCYKTINEFISCKNNKDSVDIYTDIAGNKKVLDYNLISFNLIKNPINIDDILETDISFNDCQINTKECFEYYFYKLKKTWKETYDILKEYLLHIPTSSKVNIYITNFGDNCSSYVFLQRIDRVIVLKCNYSKRSTTAYLQFNIKYIVRLLKYFLNIENTKRNLIFDEMCYIAHKLGFKLQDVDDNFIKTNFNIPSDYTVSNFDGFKNYMIEHKYKKDYIGGINYYDVNNKFYYLKKESSVNVYCNIDKDDSNDFTLFLLDLKRSGDWSQVHSIYNFNKKNKQSPNNDDLGVLSLMSGDRLCILYARIMDIPHIYVKKTQLVSESYVIKEIFKLDKIVNGSVVEDYKTELFSLFFKNIFSNSPPNTTLLDKNVAAISERLEFQDEDYRKVTYESLNTLDIPFIDFYNVRSNLNFINNKFTGSDDYEKCVIYDSYNPYKTDIKPEYLCKFIKSDLLSLITNIKNKRNEFNTKNIIENKKISSLLSNGIESLKYKYYINNTIESHLYYKLFFNNTDIETNIYDKANNIIENIFNTFNILKNDYEKIFKIDDSIITGIETKINSIDCDNINKTEFETQINEIITELQKFDNIDYNLSWLNEYEFHQGSKKDLMNNKIFNDSEFTDDSNILNKLNFFIQKLKNPPRKISFDYIKSIIEYKLEYNIKNNDIDGIISNINTNKYTEDIKKIKNIKDLNGEYIYVYNSDDNKLYNINNTEIAEGDTIFQSLINSVIDRINDKSINKQNLIEYYQGLCKYLTYLINDLTSNFTMDDAFRIQGFLIVAYCIVNGLTTLNNNIYTKYFENKNSDIINYIEYIIIPFINYIINIINDDNTLDKYIKFLKFINEKYNLYKAIFIILPWQYVLKEGKSYETISNRIPNTRVYNIFEDKKAEENNLMIDEDTDKTEKQITYMPVQKFQYIYDNLAKIIASVDLNSQQILNSSTQNAVEVRKSQKRKREERDDEEDEYEEEKSMSNIQTNLNTISDNNMPDVAYSGNVSDKSNEDKYNYMEEYYKLDSIIKELNEKINIENQQLRKNRENTLIKLGVIENEMDEHKKELLKDDIAVLQNNITTNEANIEIYKKGLDKKNEAINKLIQLKKQKISTILRGGSIKTINAYSFSLLYDIIDKNEYDVDTYIALFDNNITKLYNFYIGCFVENYNENLFIVIKDILKVKDILITIVEYYNDEVIYRELKNLCSYLVPYNDSAILTVEDIKVESVGGMLPVETTVESMNEINKSIKIIDSIIKFNKDVNVLPILPILMSPVIGTNKLDSDTKMEILNRIILYIELNYDKDNEIVAELLDNFNRYNLTGYSYIKPTTVSVTSGGKLDRDMYYIEYFLKHPRKMTQVDKDNIRGIIENEDYDKELSGFIKKKLKL